MSLSVVRGKRDPGKPGRFDPTIPLHMTTRKAAKKAESTSPLQDDSSEDDTSRRASFDGITASMAFDDLDAERPSKRQRTSNDGRPKSASMLFAPSQNFAKSHKRSAGSVKKTGVLDLGEPSPNALLATQHSSIRDEDDSVAGGQSMNEERTSADSSPSKSHVVDAQAVTGDTLDDTGFVDEDQSRSKYEELNGSDVEDEGTNIYTRHGPIKTRRQAEDDYQAEQEGDWAEVVLPAPSPQRSNSREGSVTSSAPVRAVANGDAAVALSTDVTPMVTQPASPATTGSAAAGGETPMRLKAVAADLENSSDDDADEAEPAAPTQESVEEATEMPAEVEEEGDEAGLTRKVIKRRFPGGRRRAVHSNNVVEAAMRRQLELKQTYRQVTRAMKACLGELAQVTLDELETTASHAEAAEYERVMTGLNARLAQRKEQLTTAARLNKRQLLERYEGESEARRKRCRIDVEDLQDQQLIKLEYNMLQVQRAQLLEETKSGHETEDEDGLVPRPKRMAYRWKRSGAIDHRCDSRSRFTLETERMVDDLQRRNDMFEALKAHDSAAAKSTSPSTYEGYTVMDSAVRDAADERRNDVDATKELARIAEEYRKMYATPPAPPPPPPPPKPEELIALNTLADLAVRPSVSLPRQTPVPQPPQPQPPPHPFPFLHPGFFGGMPPPPFAYPGLLQDPPNYPPFLGMGGPFHGRQRSMSAISNHGSFGPNLPDHFMGPPQTPRHMTAPSPRFGPAGTAEMPPSGGPQQVPMARGIDGKQLIAAKPATFPDRPLMESPPFAPHHEHFLGPLHPSRRQFFTDPESGRTQSASEGARPSYGSTILQHSRTSSAEQHRRSSAESSGFGHSRATPTAGPAMPHGMGHLMQQPNEGYDGGMGGHKPSREERHGLSRKEHREAKRMSMSSSVPGPGWTRPVAKPVNHLGMKEEK